MDTKHCQKEPETPSRELQTLELWYDPHESILEAWYADQISCYRARKNWQTILAENFLLEHKLDFELRCQADHASQSFGLTCHFFSACGRYALWRITNQQVPEIQGQLEVAHLPRGAAVAFGGDFELKETQIEHSDEDFSHSVLSQVLEKMTKRIQQLSDSFRTLDKDAPLVAPSRPSPHGDSDMENP